MQKRKYVKKTILLYNELFNYKSIKYEQLFIISKCSKNFKYILFKNNELNTL